MSDGPDITRLAALIGDPARANILTALLSGQALTAGELAEVAGVSAPTTSGHLVLLSDAGLIRARRQGRHRYFTLHDADVAQALETLAGLAGGRAALSRRPGPNDPALRAARVCYDHLAGARGVQMLDSLSARGCLTLAGDAIALTAAGEAEMARLGIDLGSLHAARRPLCRTCLDWSERRSHLAGALGAALLARIDALGWIRRAPASRHVNFTAEGTRAFDAAFSPVSLPV
jgi:DNA-binding transcriptional ArsR family regulator